jgi:3-dehydroquinate synthase
MSDMIIISKFKEYSVDFVNDFSVPLKRETDEGAFIIVDSNVFALYRASLESIVKEARYLVVEANEPNKSLEKCKAVIETLVENKMRRNQKLVAVGGGVIQDITAFVASILYRGVEWSFIPTTLLAQGDSCIGSKTSINLGDKKNLIGNFYPPSNIYIDTTFLESLETDDIKSGIGEMLHFYFYANSSYIDQLIGNYAQVIGHRSALVEYIKESLSIKKSVIEVDEFDKGERNKFNYGHTFGHALETITDYDIKHGQAVMLGMDIANYLSVRMGLMDQPLFEAIQAKLAVNFPNYDLGRCDMEEYFNALAKDKKNIGNNLGCILAEGPGRLVRQQVPFDDTLKEMIRTYFADQVYKICQ